MDPTRFFGTANNGSAATSDNSGNDPSQARGTQPQESAVVPGQVQDQGQVGQPTQDQAQVDSQQQPSDQQPTQPDPRDERLRSLESELNQARSVISQVQNWAQTEADNRRQQQMQQQYSQRIQNARQVADGMGSREGADYLARESIAAQNELFRAMQEERQRLQQQMEQRERTLGTPMYAQHIARQAGLPEDAVDELLALGDPNLMQRYLPHIQRRHQEQQQLKQQLESLARNQQANQIVQQGGGSSGQGTIAPQSMPNLDDMDPMDKARVIYNQIMTNHYGQR